MQTRIVIAVLVSACVNQPESGDEGFEDVTVVEQGLNGPTNLRWTGNPVSIPVCWENPTSDAVTLADATTVAGDVLRDWTREVVEGQWARYARLNFTTWGTCTPGLPGIHIQIVRTGGSASAMGPSQMNGTTNGMKLNLYLDDGQPWCRANRAQFERCVKRQPLHEFGHALGFNHQETRTDYQPLSTHPDCAKQAAGNDQLIGAYDLLSTMSYCGQPGDAPWTFKTTLSPGDIAAVQTVYGRRVSGQVVGTRGGDMMSNNLSPNPTFLWDGDEAPGQRWTYNWARQAFQVQTNGLAGCLDTYPAAQHGSPLVAFSCFFDAFQKFRFNEVMVRGWGGLCLETPGTVTNGTPVRMGTCTDTSSQRWAIDTLKRIRLIGTQKCLTWSPNLGDAAVVFDCGASPNQSFEPLADGSLVLPGITRCLDVQGPTTAQYLSGLGLPRSGDRVQTFTCLPGQQNQKWNLSGRITHDSGLCVDHQSSNTNGSVVQVRSCDNSDAQRWDYYWR
jgi:Ricin-type beta-trefoil lectin domain